MPYDPALTSLELARLEVANAKEILALQRAGLQRECKPSRELAIVLTHLDTAALWLDKVPTS